MKPQLPDYFIALVKQKAGLMNDAQTERVSLVVSDVLQASLDSQSAQSFFAQVPNYLRPHKQTFFVRVGARTKPLSKLPTLDQLVTRLQLTSREEARTILLAYFAAIQTIIDRETALQIATTLPSDLRAVYTQARLGA